VAYSEGGTQAEGMALAMLKYFHFILATGIIIHSNTCRPKPKVLVCVRSAFHHVPVRRFELARFKSIRTIMPIWLA